MKVKPLLFVLVLVFLLTDIYAQENQENPQMVSFREHVVKPSMDGEYQSIRKEIVAKWQDNDFPYSWYTWTDNEFHYYHFYYYKAPTSSGDLHKAWGDMFTKVGPEVGRKLMNTVEYFKDYEFMQVPKYSYVPENPRITPSEANYVVWDVFYFKPGRTNEIDEIEREFQELLRRKNITESIFCWEGQVGTDRPYYIFALLGKDAADFWSHNMKMWEVLGNDGLQLFEKLKPHVRKREIRQFWRMPELSYRKKTE